jgi:hypothetical protein
MTDIIIEDDGKRNSAKNDLINRFAKEISGIIISV